MAGDTAPEAHNPLDELGKQLREWRQGDLILGDQIPALVIFRRTQPLTEATQALAKGEVSTDDFLVGEEEFPYLVVVSQTCDVIEHPQYSPYITLAPVVRIEDEGRANEARRGYMPRYAPVPGAGDDAFADLALYVTVEKPVVRDLTTTKITGLRDDDEIRRFQGIASRHFGRFAFPDAMNRAFQPLRQRLREKKDRDTFEGHALALVQDIRLLPTPNWSAEAIDVDLFFITTSRKEMNDLEADPARWETQRIEWEKRCAPNATVTNVRLILVPLDELDAETYAATDRLDLGGMSPQ